MLLQPKRYTSHLIIDTYMSQFRSVLYFKVVENGGFSGGGKRRFRIGGNDIIIMITVLPQPQFSSTSTGKASIPLTAADKTRPAWVDVGRRRAQRRSARSKEFVRLSRSQSGVHANHVANAQGPATIRIFPHFFPCHPVVTC